MLRDRLRAMGTDAELLLDAPPGPGSARALARARAEIRRLEAALSRFRPDSLVARLNAQRRLRVGREVAGLVARALALRDRTGGRFDPAVGAAVVALGYDRSFERVRRRPGPRGGARPGGGRIEADPDAGWVALGPGVHLDLGAIAKGHAADRACAALAEAGPALVNLGGDLAVSGPRSAGPWPVGVATLEGSLTLEIAAGGLATSGTDRRRWRAGRAVVHHVVDPRTGRAAETDLIRATAAAASAADAEAAATALLVAGLAEGVRLAEELGTPALLVPAEGPARRAGGLA